MNMKKITIMLSAIIGVMSNNTSCMDVSTDLYLYKTKDLPKDVKMVTIASLCDDFAYIVPGAVHCDSFSGIPSKTFNANARLISFDNSSVHLAMLTGYYNVEIVNIGKGRPGISLAPIMDEKYTMVRCDGEKECLVGTDKGKVWRVVAMNYPQLLSDFNSDKTKCVVVAGDKKGSTYAAMARDQWDGMFMMAGDIKDSQKGWSDGSIYSPEHVCFNRDGSLVAFAIGNAVLVYVTAILEKSKQIWRENNNTYNDTIKKALEGMKLAQLTYGDWYVDKVKKVVFHDNNTHIFAGLENGKVYYSELKKDGESKEVVTFDDCIQSLAFSNDKLAVASLKKVCLYRFK